MIWWRMGTISIGLLLDLLLGDPQHWWHPVQGMGKWITLCDKGLWNGAGLSPQQEQDVGKKRFMGGVLVCMVLGLVMLTTTGVFWLAGKVHPAVRFLLESLCCYQMLAVHSLGKESNKVYYALSDGGETDVEPARQAVSMLVGRDTEHLTSQGIIKATVETVAENTSDGVVAPLFYMLLFGAVGGVFYKAVNTMDSMLGYRNERYYYYGTVAARLDDVVNYIPSRISAFAMLVAAWGMGYDAPQAWRIYSRDRRKHKSPNSAQTESVCAGALQIQLAGDAYYFGKLYKKPYIGDAIRQVEPEDIPRAVRLMQGTAGVVYVAVMGVLWLCTLLAG